MLDSSHVPLSNSLLETFDELSSLLSLGNDFCEYRHLRHQKHVLPYHGSLSDLLLHDREIAIDQRFSQIQDDLEFTQMLVKLMVVVEGL